MLFSKPQTKPDAQQLAGQTAGHKIPAKAVGLPERRWEGRADLSIGVLVVPMSDESLDISKAFTAITKDASTTGIGIITNRSISSPQVVICLPGKSETKLLRALVRYRKELGMGWTRFGVEVTGTVDKNEYPQLGRFIGSIWS